MLKFANATVLLQVRRKDAAVGVKHELHASCRLNKIRNADTVHTMASCEESWHAVRYLLIEIKANPKI